MVIQTVVSIPLDRSPFGRFGDLCSVIQARRPANSGVGLLGLPVQAHGSPGLPLPFVCSGRGSAGDLWAQLPCIIMRSHDKTHTCPTRHPTASHPTPARHSHQAPPYHQHRLQHHKPHRHHTDSPHNHKSTHTPHYSSPHRCHVPPSNTDISAASEL